MSGDAASKWDGKLVAKLDGRPAAMKKMRSGLTNSIAIVLLACATYIQTN